MAIDSATAQNLINNYSGPSQNTTSIKSSGVKSKGILGFLERNAPTIGGTLGGILAAPLDPLTGGVASIAAAGVGSGIGQGIKNEASGKSLTNDLGGSLVSGATGQLGGKVIGGLLGKTVGKGFTKATQGVVQGAENKASSDAAQSLAEPFRGVNRTILNQSGNDLNGTMATLQSHGVNPTVENMTKSANFITGDNGIINGTKRQILGNAGKVSTEGILDTAKNALSREAGQGIGDVGARGTAANHMLSSIRQTLGNIGEKGEGSINGTADANDLLDAATTMEGRIRDLGGVQATGSNGAEARALQATRNSVIKNIEDVSNPHFAAAKLTPEDETAIHAEAAKQGLPPELAQHAIDSINNGKSLSDFRGAEAPYVNASKLAKAANNVAGGALPSTTSAAAGPGTDYAKLAISGVTGNHMGAGAAAARIASNAVTSKPVVAAATAAGKTAGLLNRVLPGGTANAGADLIGQSLEQPKQNTTDAPIPTSPTDTSNSLEQPTDIGTGTGNNSDVTYTQQQLVNDINADPKNAAQYISLYKTLQEAPSSTSNTQQQAAQNASTALQQIKDSFAAAGGGQGKIAGTLSSIMGKVGANSNVATYNDTGTTLAAQIYKALGNTGTISDQDQKMIGNLIPKVTDTESTATAKLAQLSNLLTHAEAATGVSQ